jgi:hypothetical protein
VLHARRGSIPEEMPLGDFMRSCDLSGEDTYMPCEINVSSVLPFPERAPSEIARLALARLQQ